MTPREKNVDQLVVPAQQQRRSDELRKSVGLKFSQAPLLKFAAKSFGRLQQGQMDYTRVDGGIPYLRINSYTVSATWNQGTALYNTNI
jgi:hypothetical protein